MKGWSMVMMFSCANPSSFYAKRRFLSVSMSQAICTQLLGEVRFSRGFDGLVSNETAKVKGRQGMLSPVSDV